MRGEDLSGARGVGEPRRERLAEGPAWAGVVVGVDGSLSVLGAVAWAGAEAARRGVGLHLVQVLPPSGASEAEPGVPRGRARALLHRAMGAVGTVVPGLAVSAATVRGSVGPALVSYAAQAQLLVVGSHGAGSIPMSAGRAVTYVTAHASCPVVVVPPKWAGSWPSTPSLRRVVVGVDGSGDGERALAFAAESAARLGVGLIALTAGSRSRVEQDDGAERELLATQLAGCRARHPGLTIEPRVVGGKAAASLAHAARQAQLVVVGCRGRGAAAGALLGSTSQELLGDSPCAVAVLSPRTPSPPALPPEVSPVSATPARPERSGHATEALSTVVPSDSLQAAPRRPVSADRAVSR